jgi:hypothetical protein
MPDKLKVFLEPHLALKGVNKGEARELHDKCKSESKPVGELTSRERITHCMLVAELERFGEVIQRCRSSSSESNRF